MSFLRDLKIAARSLSRVPALWITVALTLALGIGANAAIFSVVRAVLLRPLANRDEDRLLYIRQSAPGLGDPNTTFSIPEIQDLSKNLKTITELGTFSEIDFAMVGLGTPRSIPAGVVDGNYFEVMGLRPILGRLLGPSDDGPNAPGAIVLTYKFWTTSLHSDPTVLGKQVRLESFQGSRTATIVGVLEPSVPYPVSTEIIANVVTSPHHLSATMVTGREHRMTEVFARLAPGATLESARAELSERYAAILAAHPDVYKAADRYQIGVTRMHDQINSSANTILWVLFAAAALLFIIACSNVANLVLARTVRRESELAVRAALGANAAALRRALLAESILLCGSGVLAALALAAPMVYVLGRYAARFSVRADGLTLDFNLVWFGIALALVASVFLAYIPRLPGPDAAHGLSGVSKGTRSVSGSNRRLRVFAVTQITASFLLLAGAGVLMRTLYVLEHTRPAVRYHAGPRRQSARHLLRTNARAGAAVLSRREAARRRDPRCRESLDGLQRAMARQPGTEHQVRFRRRGRKAHQRSGGPAFEVPLHLAGILRDHGCAGARRPRLPRHGPREHRARRDYQQERRRHALPWPGGHRPRNEVDRRRDEVHRHQL